MTGFTRRDMAGVAGIRGTIAGRASPQDDRLRPIGCDLGPVRRAA